MVSSSLDMSFEKDLPWGWGKRCFHNSGVFQNLGSWSSLKHAYVSLELLLASAMGRNAHFYIKNKPASMDILGQPGIFPSLKCYLGRYASA